MYSLIIIFLTFWPLSIHLIQYMYRSVMYICGKAQTGTHTKWIDIIITDSQRAFLHLFKAKSQGAFGHSYLQPRGYRRERGRCFQWNSCCCSWWWGYLSDQSHLMTFGLSCMELPNTYPTFWRQKLCVTTIIPRLYLLAARDFIAMYSTGSLSLGSFPCSLSMLHAKMCLRVSTQLLHYSLYYIILSKIWGIEP